MVLFVLYTNSSCLLTTITSRQAAWSRQTLPLFPGELQFSEEEQQRCRNREKMKKQLCSCTSMTKAEPDESLSAPHMWTRESGLTECVKTAVKFPWAWPNWKLIIFSLCFLSGGGSARGEAEHFSVMRPGGNAVVNSHCKVELRPSWWRAGARSVSGGLCVSAWKCFECAELIECSVYRGCMCASWGSVVLPAIEGLTQTHACSRSHTKAKKGESWTRRKDERGKERENASV